MMLVRTFFNCTSRKNTKNEVDFRSIRGHKRVEQWKSPHVVLGEQRENTAGLYHGEAQGEGSGPDILTKQLLCGLAPLAGDGAPATASAGNCAGKSQSLSRTAAGAVCELCHPEVRR